MTEVPRSGRSEDDEHLREPEIDISFERGVIAETKGVPEWRSLEPTN